MMFCHHIIIPAHKVNCVYYDLCVRHAYFPARALVFDFFVMYVAHVTKTINVVHLE